MTLSVSDQVPPVGTKLIVNDDADETSNNSVTGASGSIYQLEIDNTNNSDNPAYLKIYDNASPVVGTTAPDFIFKAAISKTMSLAIPSGLPFNSLSFAVVVSGGTAGTTGPTNPVIVRMVTS
jgi:hypothetical protein